MKPASDQHRRAVRQPTPQRVHRRSFPRRTSFSSTLTATTLAALTPWAAFSQTPAGPQPTYLETDVTQLELEQLGAIRIPTVYGASKHEQKVTDAPSAVSVVTQDDIKKFGHRNLIDILRSTRGFYATYDRGYHYLGTRGINRLGDYGGGILITVNGHRLNEPIYDSGLAGTEFPLDVDLIERVEIIRGPGSALYGSNAFFAVVNIVTRPGAELQTAELSGSAASYDTYTGRFTYGAKGDSGWEVLLSATGTDSQGHETLYYSEFSDINEGHAEHLDALTSVKALAQIRYQGLVLEGVYGTRRKEMPTAPYGALFNHPETWTNDQRGYATLRFEHEFANDWGLKASASYDYYRFTGMTPFSADDPSDPLAAVLNYDEGLAKWWSTEAELNKTIAEIHRLSLGVEYRDHFTLEQQNLDLDPAYTYTDVSTPSDVVGTYLQGEFTLLPPLRLNAGVRYDHYSTFGDTVNPRFGLLYSPWDHTTLKALYGEAYRAPNAYEFGYAGVGYAANANLEPETIRSYELILERNLHRHLRLTAVGFYNQIDDLISQESDPATGDYVFYNTKAAEAVGGELELEGGWSRGLRGRLGYTFTEATEEPGGDRLRNSPRHLLKFALSVPLYHEKLYASLEVQTMSERLTRLGNVNEGHQLVNLNLFSRDLLPRLELSAGVYNLLNQHYGDPMNVDFTQEVLSQDGRTFRVKLTYRF